MIDPDCPICHGKGEIPVDEKPATYTSPAEEIVADCPCTVERKPAHTGPSPFDDESYGWIEIDCVRCGEPGSLTTHQDYPDDARCTFCGGDFSDEQYEKIRDATVYHQMQIESDLRRYGYA